jgi:hypothetical protein
VQVTRGRHGISGRVGPDLESCHGRLSVRSRRLPESVALLSVPADFAILVLAGLLAIGYTDLTSRVRR